MALKSLNSIVDMKSQLVILLILVSSLLATNADQQCDNLLQQCNQFMTECSPNMMNINSCCDLKHLPRVIAPSGIYQIVSNDSCESSRYTKVSTDVYCDMETTDGGWIVIQRNIKDGIDTFNRTWKEYEEGFGGLDSNKLWYGLKGLHLFTRTGQWELRIDFQFENLTRSYLHYNTFSVGTESEEYPLTIGGFTGITSTDPFVTHPVNGQRFSTIDNDNDKRRTNCAAIYNSGWWYNNCFHISPNRQGPSVFLNSENYNLFSTEMKIRPRDCIVQ